MAISAGTVAAALTLETGQFEKGMNSARSMMQTLKSDGISTAEKIKLIGSGVSSLGGVMTAAVTMPLVAAGTAATKTFMDFDDAMRQVRATMNASEEDTARLTEAAKKYGAETRYSASEAASALNYLALAGYDANKSIEALPVVLRLAQAGGLDLAYASDLVTDSMSALGLEMEQLGTFTDQLARTAQKSNTSVSQLGQGILQVGGTAKSLKGGTEELNTALGILADNGIKGAEGGTHLRNMLLRLQGPTKEGAAALAKYTNGVYDADGRMRSLNDIFGELRASMDQLTDEERSQVLSDIFRVTDLAAAQAMVAGAGERFDELSASIRESKGAAQEMADVMEGGIGGSFRNLKSAAEGLAIEIGETLAPSVQDAANWVTGAERSFAGLDEGMKKTVVSAAGVAAAAGPVMIVLGKVPALFSAIAKGATVAKGAVTALTSGPAGLAAVAVVMGVAMADMINYERRMQDAAGVLASTAKESAEDFKRGLEIGKTKVTADVEVEVNRVDTFKEAASTLYTDIYTWLTDGMPDSEEEKKAVNDKVNEYFGNLISEVDTSENEELEKLKAQFEAGFLTYDEYTAKTAEVMAKAEEARTELTTLKDETLAFVENYAGAPTTVVAEAYGEIDRLEARTQELLEKIMAANTSLEEKYGSLAEAKVATGEDVSPETIGEAMGAKTGRAQTKKKNRDLLLEEKKAALESANASMLAEADPTDTAALDRIREIYDKGRETLREAERQSQLLFEADILQGMMDTIEAVKKAYPEQAAILEDATEEANRSLREEVVESLDSEALLTVDGMSERMRALLKRWGWNVEEMAGMAAEQQDDHIRAALSQIGPGLVSQTEESALLELNNTELGDAIGLIIQSGADEGVKSVDLTDAETQMKIAMGELVTEGMGDMPEEGQTQASLFTAAIGTGIENGQDDVTGQAKAVGGAAWKAAQAAGMNNSTGFALGRNFGKGMAGGILAEVASVEAAAGKLAEAGAKVIESRMLMKSPSRVTRRLGQFFAQGWTLGIKDGYFDAETAAAGLAKLPKGGDAGAGRGSEIGGPVYNISVNGATIRSEDEAEALIRTATRVRARTNRGYGY